MHPQRLALAAAITSSLLSSLTWVFQGAAVLALNPLSVASAQCLLTGVIYLLGCAITKSAPPLASLRGHAREFCSFVFLRYFLGGILFCYALLYSGSIKVMFFTKIEPYFILFWSWLLYQRTISRTHTLLLGVHIGGAILLSMGGPFESNMSAWGDAVLIVGLAVISYSYLQATRLAKELGSIHLNGAASILGGLMLLPIALVASPIELWNPWQQGWLYVLIVAIIFNVFSMTLWYWALARIESWLVSALRAVGPVLAAPFAWIFFDQTLTGLQLFGAFVVLATSAALAQGQRRTEGKA
jgi:drug/metabolite transporter (DMT)-like permease